MRKSHMKKNMLKMDRYHFVIIMCQHCAHYKAYKMDFGPSFFLPDFYPPNVATMGLNKLWMPSSKHKCCLLMTKKFTTMVRSKDNNPQNDNPIINVFGNLHTNLASSLKRFIIYIQQ
jgi:hypothetical protein